MTMTNHAPATDAKQDSFLFWPINELSTVILMKLMKYDSNRSFFY